jgi:glucokinase
MPKSGKLILGVDIGGTKIASGLVNPDGKILYSVRKRMSARKSAGEGLEAVRAAIDEVLRENPRARPIAIGVSVPGWVDSTHGVLLSATNLPCWTNFPLAQEIEDHYHLPTHVANDANAAALAEAAWGAGAGYRNVFYVTLGTGIGTALVLSHRIYPGRTGAAGEGGHMTINFSGPLCGCGKRGCIEIYASGTAIARSAREHLGRAPKSSILARKFSDDPSAITAEAVAEAAKAGDPLAAEILDEAADHFAIWLGSIIDLLEPEIIVLGGGVARLMMAMLDRIRQRMKTWAINPRQQQIPIVNASYGSESGLVGAAALCLSRSEVWSSQTVKRQQRSN